MSAKEKLCAIKKTVRDATNANNANYFANNEVLFAKKAAEKANANQEAAEKKKRIAEYLLIGAIQEAADAVQADQDAFRAYQCQELAISILEDLNWRRINVLEEKRRLESASKAVADTEKKKHKADQEVLRADNEVRQMTQCATEATTRVELALVNARNTWHYAQHNAMNALHEQLDLEKARNTCYGAQHTAMNALRAQKKS